MDSDEWPIRALLVGLISVCGINGDGRPPYSPFVISIELFDIGCQHLLVIFHLIYKQQYSCHASSIAGSTWLSQFHHCTYLALRVNSNCIKCPHNFVSLHPLNNFVI